ncbi:MAG TPA: threonine synthase [Candidatus Marinimicrobia bacterium]|nr:threonine synthase [Candidatus Neomarinimicrobiota bacterium]
MVAVCSRCGRIFDSNTLLTVCDKCGGAILIEVDLDMIGERVSPEVFKSRIDTFWKFFEVLPLKSRDSIVSIGEPFTPVVKLSRKISNGFRNVFAKNDGYLPTGTFKARGMAVAVSILREFGVDKIAIPSAGNAAAALSAYGARAGMDVYAFMPKDAPLSTLKECVYMGAHVYLVDGLINDAGVLVSKFKGKYGWFDVSTNKQPYRFEGYKLMAYEVSEQFDWNPPDIIIFPTGGGEGVIGFWKGFNELVKLGWIEEDQIPKLIIVQSTGCMPLVKAFNDGLGEVEEAWRNASTIAAGLRVPKPYASYLVLKAVRDTGGYALAVSDAEIVESIRILAGNGIFVCPEAAATHAALKHLRERGIVDADSKILLYFTGTGLKYLDVLKLSRDDLPILERNAEKLT